MSIKNSQQQTTFGPKKISYDTCAFKGIAFNTGYPHQGWCGLDASGELYACVGVGTCGKSSKSQMIPGMLQVAALAGGPVSPSVAECFLSGAGVPLPVVDA